MIAQRTQRITIETYGLMSKLAAYCTKKGHVKRPCDHVFASKTNPPAMTVPPALRRAARSGNRVAVGAERFHEEADHLAKRAWGSHAAVREIRSLAGDASSRCYFRVELDRASSPTAVLMVQTGSGLSISSDELSSLDAMPDEMPFLNVQRYMRGRGVAVPEVYAADSPGGLALLEDLGDTTLWDAAGAASDVVHLYRAAIDELVLLQRAGAEQPDSDCIAFRQRFDARLFLWEFDHFLEYGLSGRSVSVDDRAMLRRCFAEIADELAAGPLALTHRDYHS